MKKSHIHWSNGSKNNMCFLDMFLVYKHHPVDPFEDKALSSPSMAHKLALSASKRVFQTVFRANMCICLCLGIDFGKIDFSNFAEFKHFRFYVSFILMRKSETDMCGA